jgi:RNA 3'-terminal phosphate cyclase
MKTSDLPLDTWVVVEPLGGGEVRLMSKHANQQQAEAERDRRNGGLTPPRFRAVRALAPIAGGQQACAAVVKQRE